MAATKRQRSGRHSISGSGNRFDTPLVHDYSIGDQTASPGFRRQIKRCKRCGSRIVSNTRKCPYCGKSVLPLYKKLKFWLPAILLLAAGTTVFLILYEPSSPPDPLIASGNSASHTPVAVGELDSSKTSDLALGQTIYYDDLLITVIEFKEVDTSANGDPIVNARIEFRLGNNAKEAHILLSTSWQLEKSDGSRIDSYIGGKNQKGENISSGISGQSLTPGSSIVTDIYFTGTDFTRIVYLVNPLSSDGPQVSWNIAGYANSQTADAVTGEQDPAPVNSGESSGGASPDGNTQTSPA
ncbi:MAG: zinc ribbon domain-containing protein [Coriobacteriales bacterium]|nr:zinc ribbon domain-containing protein [Coriobacteriales bacterium]